MPKTIEHFVMMGDSLSDRGTMAHRKLFGLIPMNGLSGLKSKSPKGRFTNGYTWDDELGALVSEEAIIKTLEQKGKSAIDIADDIIDHDPLVEHALQQDFNLDSDRSVDFQHQDFMRNYDEGGLTAYDYHQRVTDRLSYLGTEKILSRLDQKRELLLQDDKARNLSQEHKEKTLIVEWSGANDLLTVNVKPTKEEADKAVEARIRNVEILINNGYCNFALFNLPDLSLTPRFQSKTKTEAERENAQEVSLYFNQKLAEAVKELGNKHRYCSMDVFDINRIFTDAYNNPEKYGFEVEKIHTPYTQSPDFKLLDNGTSPSTGYMFWDDVHPTADMHAILGNKFYLQYSLEYKFEAPHESLLQVFQENYGQKYRDDKRGWFSFFRKSRLDYKSADLSLDKILEHALYNKGYRTRDTIIELGWINKDGQLMSDHPSLVAAMKEVNARHEPSASTANLVH